MSNRRNSLESNILKKSPEKTMALVDSKGRHDRLYPIIISLLILIMVLVGANLIMTAGTWRIAVNVCAGLGSLALALYTFYLVKNHYITPMRQIGDWLRRIANSEFNDRPPPLTTGDRQMAQDMKALQQKVEDLTLKMDQQVRKQTEHMEQKNRALEIIYDLAASVNVARDLEELLTRFLYTIKDVVDAKAAVVRLLSDDGNMKLIASIGLDQQAIERERILPIKQCTCGEVPGIGRILYKVDVSSCSNVIGVPLFDNASNMHLIAVPLQYRNKILGVYNLFVDDKSVLHRDDIEGLLTNIGRHLGMAIDKARLDNEAYRLSIMEERTSLAHELHDSLAQTLASLRFQVRVLDETLHTEDESAVWREMEKIENSLDEAYAELRELITHFRAPIDSRGLIPAVRHLVERFRKQTDTHIYLQQNWDSTWLPAEVEVQVVHIVQEALTNIRKHSQAQNVRVLMQAKNNEYRILIEDDGIGIGDRETDPLDEHVGLTIMEERAQRINGELRIESEPGEGTQIILTFGSPSNNEQKTVATQ